MKSYKGLTKVAQLLCLTVLAGFAGHASASAVATGYLSIDDLTFSVADGNSSTTTPYVKIDIFGPPGPSIAGANGIATSISNKGDVFANLDGFPSADFDEGDNLSADPDTLDIPMACVGTPCGTAPNENNTFSPYAVLAADGTWARSDSLLSGTVVERFLGEPVGADADVYNEVALITTEDGTAIGDLSLISEFIITTTGDLVIDINMTATAYLNSAVSGGPFILSGDASATIDWSLEIEDENGTVFFWEPDELNESVSAGVGEQDEDNDTVGVAFFNTTPTLKDGVEYKVTILHATDARADVEIPEPGVLAMFGTGLVLLGMRRRRKIS